MPSHLCTGQEAISVEILDRVKIKVYGNHDLMDIICLGGNLKKIF